MVGSIAPEGVKAILNNGIMAYPTFASVPFRTTYEYDLLQGRLIANTQTDAGKTEFIRVKVITLTLKRPILL